MDTFLQGLVLARDQPSGLQANVGTPEILYSQTTDILMLTTDVHAYGNPYGYLPASGPASAPPGPPPHLAGYPYGGYAPYNPYGYPGMIAGMLV